jgi:alkylated DNA repair protein alkB family protein 1
LNVDGFQDEILINLGIRNLKQLKCFELVDFPGLLIIPNPFKRGYQRFFIEKCLIEYHNLPNKTNLDLHIDREGANLWQNALQ